MNLNKSLTPPCKNCLERHQMCHDLCDRYKQFKENKANVQAARTEFMNKRTIGLESVSRGKKKLLERRA